MNIKDVLILSSRKIALIRLALIRSQKNRDVMKSLLVFKMGFKSAFTVLVLAIFIISCKQETVKPFEAPVSTDMKVLKNYLSELNRIDTTMVEYNLETKMFSIQGVDQISEEELRELHKNHPIIHVQNGVRDLNK